MKKIKNFGVLQWVLVALFFPFSLFVLLYFILTEEKPQK